MNHDNETRPNHDYAFDVASRSGSQLVQAYLADLKDCHPELLAQMEKPMSQADRSALEGKYNLYKWLAEKTGHWRKQ